MLASSHGTRDSIAEELVEMVFNLLIRHTCITVLCLVAKVKGSLQCYWNDFARRSSLVKHLSSILYQRIAHAVAGTQGQAKPPYSGLLLQDIFLISYSSYVFFNNPIVHIYAPTRKKARHEISEAPKPNSLGPPTGPLIWWERVSSSFAPQSITISRDPSFPSSPPLSKVRFGSIASICQCCQCCQWLPLFGGGGDCDFFSLVNALPCSRLFQAMR